MNYREGITANPFHLKMVGFQLPFHGRFWVPGDTVFLTTLRRTQAQSAARLMIDDGRSYADMAHPYLRAFGTPIMNNPDGCWKTAAAVGILNACERIITASVSGYSKGNTEMASDELGKTFKTFFQQAIEKSTPYPYQQRLATGREFPAVLSVPTGIGKTAAIILGWLFRRRFHPEKEICDTTPRRLVYCLPMRTLVEQTREHCVKWLKNLQLDEEISVHILMGGENPADGDLKWDEHPERDAILIGTQDMLLSRGLNRGYGMSRYRWPMHFALLNNDCLWVLDETQLLGVGLTTSAQLAGLREKLSTYGTTRTLWMSATLDRDALRTVDHSKPIDDGRVHTLEEADRELESVRQLLTAGKPIEQCSVSLTVGKI